MAVVVGKFFKKLVVARMAHRAIPVGGGFADGLSFLTDAKRVKRTAVDATEWVRLAIQSIRDAEEPNPWKESTDEVIAEVVLKRLDAGEGGDDTEAEKARERSLAEFDWEDPDAREGG